ncbi:MAG: DUF3429 domain-containing protein [Lysobacterales bacterium]
MPAPSSTAPSPIDNAPTTAISLGYAGLIPFVALAIAPVTQVLAVDVRHAFITYSAVILSFLGGIRWGVNAAASTPSGRDLWIGIFVSLAGWFGCLLAPASAIIWLLTAHVGTLAVDQLLPARGQMTWLTALRLRLSIGAIVAHVLTLALT